MKTFEIEIKNPTGLHARPAKTFVNLAKQYTSKVTVFHNDKKANGKSLISLLTLGVERGSLIRVEIEGDDEDTAKTALYEGIEAGLGEEEIIEAQTPPQAEKATKQSPRTSDTPRRGRGL